VEGCPMVNFNEGGNGDTAYGIIIEDISSTRTSKFKDCYEVDITGYKLDFAVSNVIYDLTDGDYNLSVLSQLMTDNTDEQVDDYYVRLVISSTRQCSFYAQTSSDGITWDTYPDTIGWTLNAEKRVIDLSYLTGYLRIAINNTGSSASTINARLYLTK
jgi:hypothetical protein